MADTYTIYPVAKKLIPNGSISLLNDTIKIALMNNYSYNPAHAYWSDVSVQEISPTGTYAAGGTALSSKTIDLDAVEEEGYFTAANLTVGTAMSGTFQQIVIYKSTGVAATSPLIGLISLENAVTLASQTLLLQFNVKGIMRFL